MLGCLNLWSRRQIFLPDQPDNRRSRPGDLLIDSYGRITDLQCVAGSVFNEGDFGLKGIEVDRENRGSHLLAKKCFHVIVTSMYDYFISLECKQG